MEPNTFARLKRVAGKKTTILTHYGRKTGKPHEVTIWFVLDDDRLYLGTANVNRQWVRNVQKTPKIRLSIGGETFEGNARFLTERAEHERAMAAIRRKYRMFRPIIELGRFLAAIGLMRDNTGSSDQRLIPLELRLRLDSRMRTRNEVVHSPMPVPKAQAGEIVDGIMNLIAGMQAE